MVSVMGSKGRTRDAPKGGVHRCAHTPHTIHTTTHIIRYTGQVALTF